MRKGLATEEYKKERGPNFLPQLSVSPEAEVNLVSRRLGSNNTNESILADFSYLRKSQTT